MADDSILVPQRSKQARLIVLSLPIDGEAPIVLFAVEAIPLFERDEVPSGSTLQEHHCVPSTDHRRHGLAGPALDVEAVRGIQDAANVNMGSDCRRCVSDAASGSCLVANGNKKQTRFITRLFASAFWAEARLG